MKRENEMEAVEIKGLVKHYGDIRAVDDITFDVKENEIFALVGPNGAGKTTTIEIIEDLRKADRGMVKVFGLVPSDKKTKERMGVQLQTTSFQPKIKVKEVLELFHSFYGDEIELEKISKMFFLDELLNKHIKDLSGGQKQRVNIALALINDPKILFLDEPTTGLDPQARRIMWEIIENIRKEGKTIFLTTHYMEEAEKLSDRVAIIDHGKIIAMDTPNNLIKSIESEAIISFSIDKKIGISKLQDITGVRT